MPLARLQPPRLIYTYSAFDSEGQKLIFRKKKTDRSSSVCSLAANLQRQKVALCKKPKVKSDSFLSKFVAHEISVTRSRVTT